MTRLALALLAVPAGAVSLAGGSLQTEGDACACLNWRDAYKTGLASCGDGHEFYVGEHMGLAKWLQKLALKGEFCDNFYTRLDETACVNLVHDNRPGEWYSGSWCYVSDECASASRANGTAKAKVKLCTEGVDRTFRGMSPAELFKFSRERDFDVGLLVKMAYPVEKTAKWPVVSEYFRNPGPLALQAVPSEAATVLTDLQAKSKPVVLDSKDGHPPFAVMQGSRVDLIELDMAHMQKEHPSSITKFHCTSGCA